MIASVVVMVQGWTDIHPSDFLLFCPLHLDAVTQNTQETLSFCCFCDISVKELMLNWKKHRDLT